MSTVEYMISAIAPESAAFDIPTKVILLINHPLPRDFELIVKFTGLSSNKVAVVNTEKHGSCALRIVTPIFPHPEDTKVSLLTRRSKFQLCVCLKEFRFCSNLIRMSELLNRVIDPVDFMCAASLVRPRGLNFLDSELEQVFLSKMPRDFDLLKGDGATRHDEAGMRIELYPTLLHFAARYGLYRLSHALIRCHGGHKALSILNKDNQDPEAIALQFGHTALYNVLAEVRQRNNYKENDYVDELYAKFEDGHYAVGNYGGSHDDDNPYEIEGSQYESMNFVKSQEDTYVCMKSQIKTDAHPLNDIIGQLERVLQIPEDIREKKIRDIVQFAKSQLPQKTQTSSSPTLDETGEEAYSELVGGSFDFNISDDEKQTDTKSNWSAESADSGIVADRDKPIPPEPDYVPMRIFTPPSGDAGASEDQRKQPVAAPRRKSSSSKPVPKPRTSGTFKDKELPKLPTDHRGSVGNFNVTEKVVSKDRASTLPSRPPRDYESGSLYQNIDRNEGLSSDDGEEDPIYDNLSTQAENPSYFHPPVFPRSDEMIVTHGDFQEMTI